MAGRHSLTVQVDPSLPGHVAVMVSTPSGQTYAGFGPEHHNYPGDAGKLDVHTLQPGKTPPTDDYSTASGGSFAIPISEEQAHAALSEIDRIKSAVPRYNAWNPAEFDACSTFVSQVMRAAGLHSGFSPIPSGIFGELSDIEDTLRRDPKAEFTRSGLPIPDTLRGIQRDYAFVGGGYDTPRERARLSVFDTGAPALPFVPPNAIFDPDRKAPADRFAGFRPAHRLSPYRLSLRPLAPRLRRKPSPRTSAS